MTENKPGPAKFAEPVGPAGQDTVEHKPMRPGDERVGPTKVVEEPAGYDYPPTDRIPVPGDLSTDRTDAEHDRTDAERDRTNADRRDGHAEDRPAAPVEAADIAEPAVPSEPVAAPVTGSTETSATAGLFEEGAVNRFRDRWRELQSGFVDDPAQAVRGADELVDEIMRELAERRHNLEEQWRDGPGDTEELRGVIREYRAFFNQLLNA